MELQLPRAPMLLRECVCADEGHDEFVKCASDTELRNAKRTHDLNPDYNVKSAYSKHTHANTQTHTHTHTDTLTHTQHTRKHTQTHTHTHTHTHMHTHTHTDTQS